MAPEMLSGKSYDEKVDLFSFGIVVCEVSVYNWKLNSAFTMNNSLAKTAGYIVPILNLLF